MSDLGRTLRLRRILRIDGRTVIVPIDHGISAGPIPGLEFAKDTARELVEGGADAMLASPGVAQLIRDEIAGRTGLILRLDTATTRAEDKQDFNLVASVEEAIRLGADGVCVMVYVGSKSESSMLRNLGKTVDTAIDWGIPVLGEMLPTGPRPEDSYDYNLIKHAARVGAEIGAHFIKTNYSGSVDTFREVVKTCPAPIVIAGGPRLSSRQRILEVVKGAVDAGAIGTCMGRNVWQDPDPQAMTKAIVKIVHAGSGVEDALKLVENG